MIKETIRLATISDLERIMTIIRSCANHMTSINIFQWNSHYPNEKVITNDILKKELYVYENDSGLIGCVVITKKMDDEYKSVEWLTNESSCFYIHRLAVDPKFQNSGIGNILMQFAEDKGRLNKMLSIRLDTFSKNKKNQCFYEKRGYQKLESIYFPLQSEFPFFCYELLL